MTNGQRLRVLMLGWEYPPHISGGLGTACEGLTRALAPLSIDIDFVVPHLFGTEAATHMTLVSPAGPATELAASYRAELYGSASQSDEPGWAALDVLPFTPAQATPAQVTTSAGLQVTSLPALLSPYLSAESYRALRAQLASGLTSERDAVATETHGYFEGLDALPPGSQASTHAETMPAHGIHYGADLFQEVSRFAGKATQAMRGARPDIIHAHDWMTFPAATELARLHRVPLVLHVHSLEQDRSGHAGNHAILAIEGAALRAATRVIAVSHYTARMVHEAYGVPLHRIDVVHNGVYESRRGQAEDEAQETGPRVLFLGRITYQKGPEYFVEAAAKVLEQIPHARFVMAGSGDMQPHIEARVRELGIEDAFEFPGFVSGPEVERLFSTADVYVMPSVSEPFGITALEAMSFETPVILSRQSGAAEILKHALKVDFWDIQKLAGHIISVLRYPELRQSLVEMAREEVRRVHWEASAQKVKQVYQQALRES